MECNKSMPQESLTQSTLVLIHVFFSYTATCMNEGSAGGGDFAEQLSSLIFKKKFFQV